MRVFLSMLEASGDLVTIAQPVSLLHEIAACLGEADDGPAMIFSAPLHEGRAHPLPVVGNLLNTLPRYAAALNCNVADIQAKLIAAVSSPIAHKLVDSAPCQDVTIDNPSLVDELPIPHFLPTTTT